MDIKAASKVGISFLLFVVITTFLFYGYYNLMESFIFSLIFYSVILTTIVFINYIMISKDNPGFNVEIISSTQSICLEADTSIENLRQIAFESLQSRYEASNENESIVVRTPLSFDYIINISPHNSQFIVTCMPSRKTLILGGYKSYKFLKIIIKELSFRKIRFSIKTKNFRDI